MSEEVQRDSVEEKPTNRPKIKCAYEPPKVESVQLTEDAAEALT